MKNKQHSFSSNIFLKTICLLGICTLLSCGAQSNKQTEQTDSTSAQTVAPINVEKQANSGGEDLHGTWLSSHEPFGYVFRADGTMDMIEISPEAGGEKVTESGKWSVSGDMLTMDLPNGKSSGKINFINGILYIGDLPTFQGPDCTECEYKTAEEYVAEMGFKKK